MWRGSSKRVRWPCVFCWRKLIGSRNKANAQPVKLIAFSDSTRTGVSEASAGGRGKQCSRVCPPPPPPLHHDINTTPSRHNHNTRYLSWTPYWSHGPSSLYAERVQNRLLLLLSTIVLFVFGGWIIRWPPLEHLPGCHLYLLSPQSLTHFYRFISPVLSLSRSSYIIKYCYLIVLNLNLICLQVIFTFI